MNNIFSAIEKATELNKDLNAFITIDKEAYKKCCKENLPLCGMPIAVKDNICTKGMRTTCASQMLESFVPCYDAYAIAALKKAGAVVLGKTNMDEFGMGSTGGNSFFGATVNPIDKKRIPGGSSSGSAVAVAAGIVPAALGTDTGGSVRQPAAYCGVVGLKPSYGAVSRAGLVAFASSLDQIGILADSVDTVWSVASEIYSYDCNDMTSRSINPGNGITEGFSLNNIRIGVCEKYNSAADDDILAGISKAEEILKNAGAEIVDVQAPMTEQLLAMYYILSSAEASSNLSRFDGIKYGKCTKRFSSVDEIITYSRYEGFGDEVKRRILLGTFVLTQGYYEQYYARAEIGRRRLMRQYNALLKNECDIFLSPVTLTTAPEIGCASKQKVRMYEGDYYTVAANLTGMPAISIPVGYSSDGLPVGVQMMSGYGKDELLLQVASLFEKEFKGGGKL